MAKNIIEAINSKVDVRQDKSARIEAIWNKLQKDTKTSVITQGGKDNPTSLEKAQIMRENINKYEKENLKNNINALGKIEKVDPKFAELSPKEVKVIEFAAKALDELDKVKEYSAKNPRPYDKVDSYLKRIDNINKPGLLKKAAIAAGNIGSDLIKKLANHLPSRPNNQNKGESKERAR